MNTRDMVTRRSIVRSALAVGGIAVSAPAYAGLAQITPIQGKGPFYPIEKPLDQDADLTAIAGKTGRAQGQIVHLTGRVLDSRGRPVRGTIIEIWQANAHGRYSHPGDSNQAPLDPNFEGFSVQQTDDQGRYRFKTIKPGPYPVDGSWTRPPHIHFDIKGRGSQIVTQMYFENESLNDVDKLLQGASNRQALIAQYGQLASDMEAGSLAAVWDIIVPHS